MGLEKQYLAPLVPASKDLNSIPKPKGGKREVTEKQCLLISTCIQWCTRPHPSMTHIHADTRTHINKIKLDLQRASRIVCGSGILGVLPEAVTESVVVDEHRDLWNKVGRLSLVPQEC